MADLEDFDEKGSTPIKHSDDSNPIQEFAPISSNLDKANTRPELQTHRTISRTRSNNGYSCDGNDASSENLEPASDQAEDPDKDPFEVHWEGDHDPMNPRSMSLGRKWLVVLIVSASSFCVTCTSSIYTATYAQIEEEFQISRIVATLGLSLFIMGLGLGPMLLGPLSEFFGRRPIYLISFALFVIWIIPSAVATNVQTMLIARFFDGLSGSAFLSVSGGTVGDMFTQEKLQLPILFFTAAPFIGPSINLVGGTPRQMNTLLTLDSGPLIGGYINQYTNWRWTFYTLIIWSAINYILIVLFVPETYHPVLLRKKAMKIRKEKRDERWKAPMEKTNKSMAKTIQLSLLRPFQLLFLEPMCLNLCLFSAILLGILYLFFGAFALVFIEKHGFSLSQNGLAFLGIFVGMLLAAFTDPFWQRNYMRLVKRRQEVTGEVGGSEPEYRLPPAIAGGFLVPFGLFMFAWTSYSSVHWIVPIIGSAIFGMGTLLVFSGVFTFLVHAYPIYAASALAANSFARSSFGAAFPLFGIQMYEKLGNQWATTLLAFLTLAMTPFPIIFFYYGKSIRGVSRFATS